MKPRVSGESGPPDDDRLRRWNRWTLIAIAGLLAAHGALVFHAARHMGVTHDEYWHLPVGLLSWRTGKFDFDPINPPLLRMWAAIPLAAGGARTAGADAPGEALKIGDAFLQANSDHYLQWFRLGRMMILSLSVATGAIAAAWSWQVFGRRAACLTVLLWAFDPTAIAFGSLVTTDAGTACCFMATLYALWRFAERPTWLRTVGFALLLGLAQLAKFTSILLVPLSVVLWWVLRWRRSASDAAADRGGKPSDIFARWAAAFVLSLLVLNAGYLFRGSGASLDEYHFRSTAMSTLKETFSWASAVPIPLPRAYLEGLDVLRAVLEQPHPVWLDGRWETHGVTRYYLMTLAYKLPHTLHVLVACSVIWMLWSLILRQSEPAERRWQSFLLLPILLICGMASTVGMQLGIRYILPVLPVLIVFAGQSARWWNWKQYPVRTIIITGVVIAVPWSVRYLPHHLTYFNELAGGPIGGRHHLLDSNLDWGQDLFRLAEYVRENQIEDLGLAYFGTVPPAAAGLDYKLIPWIPDAGWYAVSVNFVMGRPHTVRGPDGEMHFAMAGEYAYFQTLPPHAHIGYSIDIFYISEHTAAQLKHILSAPPQDHAAP